MTDLGQQMDRLRAHVAPRWTAEREQRVLGRTRRAAGSATRWWLAASVALGAVSAAVLVGRAPDIATRPADDVAGTARAGAHAEPTLRLADGTAVTSLSDDTQVVQSPDSSPGETILRLVSGAARFDVTPRADRVVRVLTVDAEVQVIGTRFVVTLSPRGTRVAVERGRVALRAEGIERELGAGEAATAPRITSPRPAETAAVAEPLPSVDPAPRHVAAPPTRQAKTSSFRELAEAGDYKAALAALDASGKSVGSDPAELLLAADVARLGGEPERAVPWLRKVVSDHPGDSRAPLAAFTLGRTLLDQLGRPREAAEAFAVARRLSPGGTLVEDALAREIESWARAGDTRRARRRAKEYVATYPEGRRRRDVERWVEP